MRQVFLFTFLLFTAACNKKTQLISPPNANMSYNINATPYKYETFYTYSFTIIYHSGTFIGAIANIMGGPQKNGFIFTLAPMNINGDSILLDQYYNPAMEIYVGVQIPTVNPFYLAITRKSSGTVDGSFHGSFITSENQADTVYGQFSNVPLTINNF
jgi:hypothetical protein